MELAGYFRYYRLAALVFADLGLEIGLEEESLKVMESVIMQVPHLRLSLANHLICKEDYKW
jgi:hypothetical protein